MGIALVQKNVNRLLHPLITTSLHLLYNIGIRLYSMGISIASLFHSKAKLWWSGRKNIWSDIEQWRSQNSGEVIWMHCASLGEFEQGRPVLEALRKKFPSVKLVLTFFSPSGFEVRKNYSGADFICYLPSDTPQNATRFVQTLQPKMVLIVKYEYWANYFFQCKNNHIPLFILSGILRPDQRFFGIFSGFWKDVLRCVTHFFVQNKSTQQLLQSIQLTNCTITGDTRFDRVIEMASQASPIDEIHSFCQNSFCVIAGSSWPAEEKMLQSWLSIQDASNVRLILVPHEISENHIQSIQHLYPNAVRWTQREQVNTHTNVLIVDAIGMLSSIYRYGHVAIIGGGFGKGIHNTLEAAVWKIPVLFGPNYHKFDEAIALIEQNGGYHFDNEKQLHDRLNQFKNQPQYRETCGNNAYSFVMSSKGATALILEWIDKNKLLTA